MKLLSGTELVSYIKERQAKQVRNLRQALSIEPKLAIVQTIDDPVIDTYVRMKKAYGKDILIDVEVYKIDQADIIETIKSLNQDDSVHGIIIQLPLADIDKTDEAVNSVSTAKDVDGLAKDSSFIAATPMAIDWLLVGYGIELQNKKIAIVGKGRLVGAPLASLWENQGRDITMFDRSSMDDLSVSLRTFDVIVTAAGVPHLISSNSVKVGAIVVDAATSSEEGKIVGDVDESVRLRDDVTITPQKGGVGPLTVAALFDNVITAARSTAKN